MDHIPKTFIDRLKEPLRGCSHSKYKTLRNEDAFTWSLWCIDCGALGTAKNIFQIDTFKWTIPRNIK